MVRILQELKEDGQVYAADLLFQVGIWFCSRNDSRPLSKLPSMNVIPRLITDDATRHRGEILSTYSVAPLVVVGWGGSRSSSHPSPRARRSSTPPTDDTSPSLTYASLARPSPSRSPSASSTSSVSASRHPARIRHYAEYHGYMQDYHDLDYQSWTRLGGPRLVVFHVAGR